MRTKVMIALMMFCWPLMAADVDRKQFAQCIAESGAKYYGAHWCPQCKKQNAMFGRHKKYLPYIECSKKGSREKLSRCDHIKGYPTWSFPDGTTKSGVLSFVTLSYFTGCKMEKTLFIIKEV